MIRLHITTEGQTEQRFVKECLSKHLAQFGIMCDARCVLTSADPRNHVEYRGGFRRIDSYSVVRRDIDNWLKEDQDRDCFFTTMFDYYALPDDFPGMTEAHRVVDKYEKVQCLEEALKENVGSIRFIPYIQLHEFEALIFAAPQFLDWEYLESDVAIQSLVEEAKHFDNPELINDSPITAPSKRIIRAIPEHARNKTSGAFVASKIGMSRLMDRCRHFGEWVHKLEALVSR